MSSATWENVRFRQAKRERVSGVRRPCGGARGPVARSAATTSLALPHVHPRPTPMATPAADAGSGDPATRPVGTEDDVPNPRNRARLRVYKVSGSARGVLHDPLASTLRLYAPVYTSCHTSAVLVSGAFTVRGLSF